MNFFNKTYISQRLVFGCFCFLFSAGVLATGFAQNVQEKPELSFQRIQQPLLSNTVSEIHQDKLGFIWIGTYSGLHKYDGIEFHAYTHNKNNPKSLSSNFVQDLYEDRNNDLWIRTREGISRYNRSTDNFTNFDVPSNPNVFVNNRAFDEDSAGTLWAMGENGLYHFDREQETFITTKKLGSKNISALKAGRGSVMWVATQNSGLIKFNTESQTVEQIYSHDPDDLRSISSDYLNVLEIDSEGNLWIGTNDAGLDRMVIDEGEARFVHYRYNPKDPHSLGNNDIFSLYVDKKGQFWIGNENGGLHLYNPGEDNFYRYKNDPRDLSSISSNSIYCVFEDQAGRYWVGTGLNGLNISDPYVSKFKHYNTSVTKESWLTNSIIRAFYEAENGNFWIGTDGGGLNYFDRETETFRAYRHNPDDPNSLQSDVALEIDRDKSGRLWIGTWGGSLNILLDREEGKFISFRDMIDDYRYPITNVFDVQFDSQHPYVWIAAHAEALYRYNSETGELRPFTLDPENEHSLSSNVIQHLYEDSKGNLWISTENGLNLLRTEDKQEGIFERYMYAEDDTTSIPNNVVRQVFEDSKEKIWVVTKGGLSEFVEEKNHFNTYDKSDGLPSNEVRSVIESDNQNLWVGTIKGLSKFDPEKGSFKNYDRSDGLQANEFSRQSAYKLSSGELLFGGINGFNLFHPDNIYQNPNIPPVYLSDFELYNQSVDINDEDSPLDQHISMTDTLVLSYQDNIFTLEFVALNYTRPVQNQYTYKLEGFEDKWNNVGNQRSATYTNLDPGEYTFRVKAANNDGVWNEEGVSLALIITPPFWQTTWFYILSCLFVVGAVVSAYRYRVRSIRAHNKQLEEEVDARTSELKDKNEDLESALQELKETRTELVEKAHKAGMADLATGVLHNIGNILNSVNISTTVMEETLDNSKLPKFKQANELLEEHKENFEEFLLNDPRGMKLLDYYLKLGEPMDQEHQKLKNNCSRLVEKVNLMMEVIDAQQEFAKVGRISEEVHLEECVEDALKLQAGSIERHNLDIQKDFDETEKVLVQQSKLIHILINLYKNAKEAMTDVDRNEKKIIIHTHQDHENVYLSVSDNGSGIKPGSEQQIFNPGFTTKASGHGYGLHTCANYMTEMGGSIRADNKDDGKGAVFTLTFPKIENRDKPLSKNKVSDGISMTR